MPIGASNDQEMNIILRLKNEAERELGRFQGQLESMQPTFKRMAQFGTAAFVGVSGAVIATTRKLGQNADQLLDLETITGISTDTLQEFQQVSRVAGVNTDALTNAVSGLSRRMSGIIDGTGNAHGAMQALGISIRDANGDIRGTEDVMVDAIIAMGAMENELERAAAANDIFGRRWEELAPIMALGADGIEEARRQARELGLVMGKDTLQSANELRIEYENLSAQIGAVRDRFAIAFIPIMMDVLEAITPVINSVRAWIEENPELTRNIIMAVGVIGGLVAALGTVGLALIPLIASFKAFAVVIAAISVPAWGIIALLGVIGVTIGYLALNWRQHWDNIKWAAEGAYTFIKEKVIDPLIGQFERVLRFIERIREGISNIGGSVGGAVSNTFSSITSRLPGFATGGVVPGPPGKPTLALVHGQERIQSPTMRSRESGAVVINNQTIINNPTVRSDEDVRAIRREVDSAFRGVFQNFKPRTS